MKTKLWYILGGVAIAGLLIWLAVWGISSGVEVEAATARIGRAWKCVDERAKTRLPETYRITMPVTGRLAEITLGEGDLVVANDPAQPVARLVAEDLQLAVEAAEANVEQLDASIVQNLAVAMERLAMQQVVEYVKSMTTTVEAARERLKSGEQNLQYAESHLKRVRDLRASSAVSEDDLERAELQSVVAQVGLTEDRLVLAAVESLDAATRVLPRMVEQYIADKSLSDAVLKKQKAAAVARLDQARLDRDRGTITSPVDGVVLERFVRDEQFLAAGTPLLEIGRLEDLEVEAEVLTTEAVDVRLGNRVEIYGPAIGRRAADGENRADGNEDAAGRGDFVEGTVTKIYPAGFTKVSSLGVEQQRVKVIVGFRAEDLKWLREQRRLGVDYRVHVRIFTAEKPDALVIPRSALFRASDSQWQVYAIRNGRARIETVQIGLLNDEWAEVLSGMAEGDQVVLAPESNLADGASVSVKTPPVASP